MSDFGAELAKALGGSARNIGDIYSLNMQQQMARQKQQWDLEQMKVAHGYREEEEGGRQKNALELMEKDIETLRLKDTIARNQMLLDASYNLWTKQKGSQIDMSTQKYLEEMRFGYTQKEHDLIMKRLRFTQKDDPKQFDTMANTSILNTIKTLMELDEFESANAENAASNARAVATGKMGGRILTEDQKSNLADELKFLNKKGEQYSKYREVLQEQVEKYRSFGYTEKGPVPKDRQEYLRKQLDILDDELRGFGKTRDDLGQQGVMAAITAAMRETGDPQGLTPADQSFLSSILKTPTKPSYARKQKQEQAGLLNFGLR